jgi:hypothetical protein
MDASSRSPGWTPAGAGSVSDVEGEDVDPVDEARSEICAAAELESTDADTPRTTAAAIAAIRIENPMWLKMGDRVTKRAVNRSSKGLPGMWLLQ